MAKFQFASYRNEYGEWVTPEPVEVDDEPAKTVKPSTTERDEPFRFAPTRKATRGYFDSEPSGSTTSTFVFAPGLLKKAVDPTGFLGQVEKSHDDHGNDDCDCGDSCSDCATKVAKNSFSPGQKIRHKKSGKVYEMVKTYCVSKDDCYCVLKRDGAEHVCLFYAGEVEAA